MNTHIQVYQLNLKIIRMYYNSDTLTVNKSVRKEGGNDFFDAQKVGLKSCIFQTSNYCN